MLCLVNTKHCTSPQTHHLLCEAWWWKRHALGMLFSAGGPWRLVEVEVNIKYSQILEDDLIQFFFFIWRRFVCFFFFILVKSARLYWPWFHLGNERLKYEIYCQEALFEQRNNLPNINFLSFCAKFMLASCMNKQPRVKNKEGTLVSLSVV